MLNLTLLTAVYRPLSNGPSYVAEAAAPTPPPGFYLISQTSLIAVEIILLAAIIALFVFLVPPNPSHAGSRGEGDKSKGR